MKKITIAGKEYEAHLTGGTLLRFKRESGFDFLKEPERVDSESLFILAWAALKGTAERNGEKFDMSVEEMADQMSLPECNALGEWLQAETTPEDKESKKKKKGNG